MRETNAIEMYWVRTAQARIYIVAHMLFPIYLFVHTVLREELDFNSYNSTQCLSVYTYTF